MKICIASAEHSAWGGIGHSLRRLAAVLASRHEVTLIQAGGGLPGERPHGGATPGVREVEALPSEDLAGVSFAGEAHRRSAALLDAIERAYGSAGPDYLEVCDYRASGLVPLQARRAGHPALRDTLVGIRISSPAEMLALSDGTSTQGEARLLAELEREQLRLADRLVWPGGDILDLYRRYYTDVPLPEAVLVRRPFAVPAAAPELARLDTGQPLKILFVGRLQRLKGVLDLVQACLRLPLDDWSLTLIGADTPTAPLGQSMRLTIEEMCQGDPRIQIEDALPHEELQRRWSQHDLVALPSTFEVWGNVALEAMRAGLPVLATPVGGFAEIVDHGVSGWLADDVGPAAIGRALEPLVRDRAEVDRVRRSGAVFERFLALSDPDQVLGAYESMLGAERLARPSGRSEPLVTVIIPYHRAHLYIEDAVASLSDQAHQNFEVLIVNDGSFEAADSVLSELAREPRVRVLTQLNKGEGAARNLGIALARGEFLAMLDADNLFEPEFLSRALEVLRREPELAYVTSWLRFIGPDGTGLSDGAGYAPLGNRVLRDDEENWDGDAAALFPRSLFTELDERYDPAGTAYSDWDLYRRLRARGRFGAVIPELLVRYRVLPGSLLRGHAERLHRRGWDESRDWQRRRQTRWTARV
jgi:glycosyltransferase involved in cell wall biosynthesis/GT2 family glycosyltransferase